MPLWTDLIDPATLTGYVRASLQAYEEAKGSLSRWLPNVLVNDINVRFIQGPNGLVAEARFRAYDAEPEIGKLDGGKRVTLELPALSLTIPVSEYDQLRNRRAPDVDVKRAILDTADIIARGISDRMERLRGTVLRTGKATVNQDNYLMDEDFGRDPALNVTATTLWTTAAVDRLGQMQDYFDLYRSKNNGEAPGTILAPQRAFRALQSGSQLATALVGGGSRPASVAEVHNTVEGAGFPAITIYDRSTSGGRVLPDDTILLLPAQGQSALGATFWGATLTSTDPDYQLAGREPGVVTGVYRGEKPPMIAEVIGDAIGMPVLANANLSMAIKVL